MLPLQCCWRCLCALALCLPSALPALLPLTHEEVQQLIEHTMLHCRECMMALLPTRACFCCLCRPRVLVSAASTAPCLRRARSLRRRRRS